MSSHWNRREFLKNSSTATLAALAAGAKKAEIYKASRFSDHAPLTIDYDFQLG
jgi:hypothetical protein